MNPQEPLWTTEDVAKYLKCCEMTVYRMAKSGELPIACKVGREYRFNENTLRTWMGRSKGEVL